MHNRFFWRLVIIAFTLLMAEIAVISCANAEDTVTLKVSEVKAVTVYSKALEAENAQYKQSLESERQAVTDMVKAMNEERQASMNYTSTLEAKTESLQKENAKLKRSGTIKNYAIAILSAGVIGLAIGR